MSVRMLLRPVFKCSFRGKAFLWLVVLLFLTDVNDVCYNVHSVHGF